MARDDETIIVLKPPHATISVIKVAEKHHWRYRQQILPAERRLYEEIYEVPSSGTIVRIIDDHFVMIVFVALEGPGRSEVEAIIRQEVETLDDKSIAVLLKSNKPKDRATGLRILGAIAPDVADPNTVKVFSEAAKDRAPEVVAALMDAVSRASWPELWPVIEELAKADTPEAKVLYETALVHVPRPR
jgi:hypothetical protein